MRKAIVAIILGLLWCGNVNAMGKAFNGSEDFIYYKVNNFAMGPLSEYQTDKYIPEDVIRHCGKFNKNVYKFLGDNQSIWPKPTHDKRYVCARNSDVALQVVKSSTSKWQKRFIEKCKTKGLLIYNERGGYSWVKKQSCYEIVIKEENYPLLTAAEQKEQERLTEEARKKAEKEAEEARKKAEKEAEDGKIVDWEMRGKIRPPPGSDLAGTAYSVSKKYTVKSKQDQINAFRQTLGEFDFKCADYKEQLKMHNHTCIIYYIEYRDRNNPKNNKVVDVTDSSGININNIEVGWEGFVVTIAKKPEKKKPKKKEPVDEDDLIIIGSGSGFFVSNKGHVVSNDHVVGICEKVKAYEEGKAVILDILTTDMVNDLGLIKGKFKNTKYLNIKVEGAELGEDIVAFGYPLSRFTSDNVKLTKGIVSALSGPGNNYSQIQIDAAIQPGSSGGPILNMNGQVVGVAVSGLSKKLLAQEADYIPENVNFAVAAQSLSTFLKANKIEVSSGQSRIYSTKQLAKIGEPATIQLFCMNTREAYAKLKKANKHSDVLLDLE